MKSVRRFLTAAGLATLLAVAAAVPASATTEYPAGGIWNHGFSGVTLYSNYFHSFKTHRSSVQTSFEYYSSPWTTASHWSYASAQSSLTGNKAYYDVL